MQSPIAQKQTIHGCISRHATALKEPEIDPAEPLEDGVVEQREHAEERDAEVHRRGVQESY
ncbi:Uncharacterized protein OBRU01_00216 [Operophtera brumata]|uniref:Uncharacterized protein n=1 Tax=Operophtera brumata TaxID=104452 RepID=A0A0L7LWE2_OPEBR|nr:Uncharacterized protein OBRU01_14052 [Operophtera brumata]KOB79471.1 Uncharacterized protein OBRU01_00216 [Operophtera brumata]